MITELLQALAGKIAAAGPQGWRRAELRGYADGDGGSGHSGFVYEPGDVDGEADPHEELCAIADLAGGQLTVELVVEARGRFEAVISGALERDGAGGFLYVLDRNARPAEPGTLQPGPVNATPAGDPVEAIALLGAYLRGRDRVLGRDTYAPPPALSTDYRDRIEARLPASLPADLRALYSHIDGDGGIGLLAGYPWFGLETLEHHSRKENRWWAGGHHDWRVQPLITSTGPPQAVRRVSDHPCWLPFATGASGDFLAVDLAPGPGGRPGQVIRIGTRYDDGAVYVADSVTALLRRHVTALRAGAHRTEDGEVWIEVEEPYEESRSLTVTGANAATMRGLHSGIERLKVIDAPWADFGPVRGAQTLWQVTVENCPGADLTPLRDTPVERLDLTMDAVDLAPLAGHGTLRTVTLRTDRPVDLTPLLSCPRLYALDLADATAITDLGPLEGLKGLLYLRLRRAQWEQITCPPGLAAAVLAAEPPREKRWWWSAANTYHPPEPSLRAAVGWAGRLAGPAADVRVIKGRFPRST
ncbi:Cell wall assembly regulator SMI1 [Nonomuraea solani]|uniref:Cell wall assembly regulator SMI1 n=1 Tax=Nonomuraea solani TaxID=1144553 RepID=A0A1H6D4P0_9ACTN|nr:SMI1/KNR4 family protein [Nonomuraea solani]SEG79783.1 Cell wall assembly regulator SMI1 [Nonomuraea solani]